MSLLPSVRTLIAASIHSLVGLELLLLLHRSPDTYWTAAAAASALGTTEERTAAALESLRRHRLIVEARETEAFRYAPRKSRDREAVEALARAYEQQRVAVLEAVDAASDASIDAFAEAFRFRRD
jgi:hypothetical protein